MTDETASDNLDDLLGVPRPKKMVAATEADSTLDDLLGSTRAARVNSADALDEMIAVSGAKAHSAEPPTEDRLHVRARWERGLAVGLFALGVSGVLADCIAASQLVAANGTKALAAVWPIGAVLLLIIALMQAKYIDRLARVSVLVWLCIAYAASFGVVIVLFASSAPKGLSASLLWIIADQVNFLIPLIVFALAGDIFTAGQGITVFPKMSRWFFIGQIVGLAIATGAPLLFHVSGWSLVGLLLVPPLACFAVIVVIPRALRDAPSSEGHGRTTVTAFAVVKETVDFVNALPAFKWLFRASLLVMAAGAFINFSFIDVAASRYQNADDLQVVYGGVALAGFVLCWLVQILLSTQAQKKYGVAKVLMVLPIATAIGAALMLGAGIGRIVILAGLGKLLWTIPRWSIDNSARQSAMAELPDDRRATSSFLINLVPYGIGLILVSIPILISKLVGGYWVVPLAALALAVGSIFWSRNTIKTWEDTQLSYRLKRRKRMG